MQEFLFSLVSGAGIFVRAVHTCFYSHSCCTIFLTVNTLREFSLKSSTSNPPSKIKWSTLARRNNPGGLELNSDPIKAFQTCLSKTFGAVAFIVQCFYNILAFKIIQNCHTFAVKIRVFIHASRNTF